MFTGIVELLCPVVDVSPLDTSVSGGGGFSITVGGAAAILDDCHVGDSIAVNGTCLTVTEFSADASDAKGHGGYFKIGVAPETLKKTNLGELKQGDRVNCERAMGAKTRFGGHFVQGHVDSTAIIQSVVPTGNALTLTLRLSYRPGTLPLPSELSPYLIPKGYVTLDGASLTLIDVSPPEGGALPEFDPSGGAGSAAAATASKSASAPSGTASSPPQAETVEFRVMLIKHTQQVIGLPAKPPGSTVNVELDMVGKFVNRAVVGAAARSSLASAAASNADANGAAAGGDGGAVSGAGFVDGGSTAAAAAAAAGASGEPTAAVSSDALTTLVERVVRKELAALRPALLAEAAKAAK